MDIINILGWNYQTILDSDDLFILKHEEQYNAARYLKIFSGLFQIGFFIIKRMEDLKWVKMPNILNNTRDMIFGYMENSFNSKNIYYNILNKFVKDKQKLSELQLKSIYFYIAKSLNNINHLIQNTNFDKFTDSSKDSYITKIIAIYSIFLISLKNNTK